MNTITVVACITLLYMVLVRFLIYKLLTSYTRNRTFAVYINTSPASPAPDKCIYALLRHRKSVHKYFPGFSGAGEVYLNTSPAPEKYLYIYTYLIPLWRRRSLGSL